MHFLCVSVSLLNSGQAPCLQPGLAFHTWLMDSHEPQGQHPSAAKWLCVSLCYWLIAASEGSLQVQADSWVPVESSHQPLCSKGRITGKRAWFDRSSSHIFFALGGVTMVMRADKNRSLTLAMLKCTQHFGVVEMGFNFRTWALLQGTKGIRTGPVKDLQQLPLLPGAHILLQAEFASIRWGVCFVHDVLLPGAAAVTGMCL